MWKAVSWDFRDGRYARKCARRFVNVGIGVKGLAKILEVSIFGNCGQFGQSRRLGWRVLL